MKKIYKIIILFGSLLCSLLFGVGEVGAYDIIGPYPSKDLHLTVEGSPYHISPIGLYIENKLTLTIDPGVTLLFPSRSGLHINSGSTLYAGDASSSQKIIMKLDGQISGGRWGGVGSAFGQMYLRNVDIIGSGSPLELYYATSTATGIFIDGQKDLSTTTAIGVIARGSVIDISSSTIKNIKNDAVNIQDSTGSLVNSIVYKSGNGLLINTKQKFLVSNNTFLANKIQVTNSQTATTSLPNNYWGSAQGPTTDMFVGKVNASPWLDHSPQDFYPCCSSVLFIPGFEATRLFTGTNQLWEPNRNADVDKLAMDSKGKSMDPNIRVGEIIKRTNIGFGIFDQNIYAGISKTFDDLVTNGSIKEWKDFPYDWRTNLSVTDPIFNTISTMADQSYTGKVTIVGHSNGGLFAKEIANLLGESARDKILDSLILVATPQVGTPSTLGALLHGDEQSLAGGLILNSATARAFGKNVPVAYNLLPSSSFYSSINKAPIRFSSSTDLSSNLRTTYGDTLTSFSGVTDFLKGSLDGRPDPTRGDTTNPALLNSLLLASSTTLHQNLLDNLSIKNPIFQIAGINFPTTEALEYSSKPFCVLGLSFACVPKYSLIHRNIKTNGGDGVVVLKSASFASTTSYLFDLGTYNTENKTNISHSNILEAIPIQKTISSLLTREIFPSFSFVQKTNYDITPPSTPLYRYRADSSVTLNVYDSAKHHTGKVVSPNPNSDLSFIQSDIPNSVYEENDQDTSVVVQGGTWPITIDLVSKEEGKVSFDMTTSSGGNEEVNTSFKDIDLPVGAKAEVVIDPQFSTTTVTMNIDVDNDGKVDKTIEAPLQGSFPIQPNSSQENLFQNSVNITQTNPSAPRMSRPGGHRRTPEYMEYIRKLFAPAVIQPPVAK